MSAPPLDAAALDRLERKYASNWDDDVQDACIAQARLALTQAERIATLEADCKRYHDERNEALGLNDYCAQTLRDLTTALREQKAHAATLRDALDETHLALFQRCGGVPPATMEERRMLDRGAAVLNATAPKPAPAKRADAGPFGKWEIEPAPSVEHDLQYTNDDNEAFDIATRVLERLWDDMEPGDTRTLRITLNATRSE